LKSFRPHYGPEVFLSLWHKSDTRNDSCYSFMHVAMMRRTCVRPTNATGRSTSVPPLPRDLADRKVRIIAAVKNIDSPMLTRVWQEIDYRIDVCRVTRGAHIEHR
jgi:hypothetical protein